MASTKKLVLNAASDAEAIKLVRERQAEGTATEGWTDETIIRLRASTQSVKSAPRKAAKPKAKREPFKPVELESLDTVRVQVSKRGQPTRTLTMECTRMQGAKAQYISLGGARVSVAAYDRLLAGGRAFTDVPKIGPAIIQLAS